MRTDKKNPDIVLKDNEATERWCRLIVRGCYAAIVINVLVLIAIWYFFVLNTFAIPPVTYWKNYILFPSGCMLAVTLLVNYLVNARRLPLRAKEYATLLLILFFCVLLCVVHRVLGALLTAFVVPVFISTIFVDFILTRRIFILSLIAQILCGMEMHFFSTRMFDQWIWLELLSASGILVASYFLAKVLICSGQYSIASLTNSINDRRHLWEQLQRDAFTSLYNRKAYDEFVWKVIEECKGSNTCLSLAMLDLDNFKKVNDTFGHLAGDKVLLRLAHILLNNSDENIHAFRLGGEEFCVLLKGYCVHDAYDVCEGLRSLMESSLLPEVNNKRITFSCGLACMNKEYADPVSLYQAADSALYAAKSKGKNQIALFDGHTDCLHPEQEKVRPSV